MPVDFQKLRNALEWAQKNPENFDMGQWVSTPFEETFEDAKNNLCGTTFCLAGIIAFQAGKEVFDTALKWDSFDDKAIEVLTGKSIYDLYGDERLFSLRLRNVFYVEDLSLEEVTEAVEALMTEFAHLDSRPKIALT